MQLTKPQDNLLSWFASKFAESNDDIPSTPDTLTPDTPRTVDQTKLRLAVPNRIHNAPPLDGYSLKVGCGKA